MDRFAIFVDAGYLLSQSVHILSSKASRKRNELTISDPKGLIDLLVNEAKTSLNNANLLRIYWYDGVKTGLTTEHKRMIEVDDVQLRAGTINGKGQQKGVDSLIVTDLVELATNHAISDALLLTGDSDLAVGISIAQKKGVRVAVMGIEAPSIGVFHNQSFEVTSVADRVIRIGDVALSPFLLYVPTPLPALTSNATISSSTGSSSASPAAALSAVKKTPISAYTPLTDDQLSALASTYLLENPTLSKANALSTTNGIVYDVDKKFIHAVYSKVLRALSPNEKHKARLALRSVLPD